MGALPLLLPVACRRSASLAKCSAVLKDVAHYGNNVLAAMQDKVYLWLQNAQNIPKHSEPQHYHHKQDDGTSITAPRDGTIYQSK
jgi:hypothetical protein